MANMFVNTMSHYEKEYKYMESGLQQIETRPTQYQNADLEEIDNSQLTSDPSPSVGILPHHATQLNQASQLGCQVGNLASVNSHDQHQRYHNECNTRPVLCIGVWQEMEAAREAQQQLELEKQV